jgi:histone H3/H4
MSDETAGKVLKAAICRIAEAEDVHAMSQSFLNNLMHLAIEHMTKVAASAQDCAESSGRSIVNVVDMSIALREHGDTLESIGEVIEESSEKPKLKPLQNVPKFPVYAGIVAPTYSVSSLIHQTLSFTFY